MFCSINSKEFTFELLSRAVRNLLNTDLALITYAQIIDGLPIADVAWDRYSGSYEPSHPINNHKTLCEGALEKAKGFRAQFTMADVMVDLERLNQYQKAKPASRSFQLRLIEMTACALHQIGVRLAQLEKVHDPATTAGHDVESTIKWERPPDDFCRVPPKPTMFVATQFIAYDRYPNGVDDMVGYWAENRILGGVALFDHSQEWTGDNEPNVYFQCTRERVTFRIMALPTMAPEVGPEGHFVLPSNMSIDSQFRNPVCIDAGLCRLCRFPINREKDKIVALTPDGRVSSPFVIYHKKCYAPLCIEKSLNICFRHCVYPHCTHKKGLAIAFHAKCVDMAAPFRTPLHEHRLVTENSYHHFASDHGRRRGRIRELIEVAMRKTYGKLSPELWHIVSDDEELIRLYTIAELSLQHRKTEWSVDPSLPVLITVARMDGVEYVGSLSNSSGRQTTELLSPSEFRNLYVESDHLGIRRIASDPNEPGLDTIRPAYWETVSASKQMLTFRGDGLKLRELLTPSIYPRILWPCPPTPSELDSMTFYYAGWGEGDLEARLRTMIFNEPGATGYSVCWANDEMVSLHVHRNVEHPDTHASPLDGHSEYQDRSLLKWTYHPVQEDEFIQEVWLRGSEKYDMTRPLPSRGEGGLRYHLSTPWGLQKYKRSSDIALALVTSKGRKIFAGSFPDHHGQYTPYSNHRHWNLVAKTSANAPLQVFFSPSDHGIPLIAAPRLLDNHTAATSPRQTPLGAMPRFNPLHTLHYSSASMENVTEVLVCKSKNERDMGVIRHFDLENSRMVETPYKKVAGLLLRKKETAEVATMSELNVHNFYRIWFTWVDPLTVLPTVYALIFTPEFILDGLIPLSMSAYNPDQAFLFHQLAALFAFVAIMLAVLLRVSSDIKVWRVVIGGVLLIDIAILVSVFVSMKQQGRSELSMFRWQDWGNYLFTGWVAVVRALFLAGVGVGGVKKGKVA
ncbi:hypothetical protein FGADI_10984 [Fusarium gaditjirri]|uniref:DUF7704 domain-containing protein n=1 Tax=Fusarium gaditjirri TaxID=282569 RepID=A0A8H4SWB9_9HYPO|nr:hypothetical protein FGADI_10984 [Fusarium gaditjirri]